MNIGWTEQMTEQLKDLYAEGLSFSQIARVLGGVTRNACISKAHRMGLVSRVVPRADMRSQPKSRAFKPHRAGSMPPPPVIELAPVTLPDGSPITMLNCSFSHCRWPLWGHEERETFPVCGNQKTEGSPYCEFHARRSAGKGTTGERAAHRGAA